MTRASRPVVLGLLLLALLSTPVFASEPIGNWTPAPWGGSATAKSGPGLMVGTNASSVAFLPITPCRVYDSRSFAPVAMLSSGGTRTIKIHDATYPAGFTPCTTMPADIEAYSMNVTVFGSAANGSYGFVTLFPTGTTRPTVSSMNFLNGSQTSNAVAVAAGTSSDINIYSTTTTHFTLDINGYYTNNHVPGNGFTSIATNAPGVYGGSDLSYGVFGVSNQSYGVIGLSGAANGIVGVSAASTGTTAGVSGVSSSTSPGASGVIGTGGGSPHSNYASVLSGPAGLTGLGKSDYGIFAASENIAGKFIAENSSGTRLTTVYLAETIDAARFLGNVSTQAFGGQAGNLYVAGTLSKAAGSFKIDHPIDPENKYLYHSFVESPDMMNIYNGVIELDSSGTAVVQLPSYFEALNQDFRYQLTAIGSSQPNLYIASEIAGNQFRIAGGSANGKVSWMVTGVRHDAYANANRIPTEVEKEPAGKGFYLHPSALGKTEEMSLLPQLRRAAAAAEGRTLQNAND